MIYIVDSYFASNHKAECIIIKNDALLIEEMTNIVGALGNLYFRSTHRSSCPPQELLEILCEKFKCKDRKHKYSGELEFVAQRIYSPMLHTTFLLCDELVVWIDIQEAMVYARDRMWSVLGEYFAKDELEQIAEKWSAKQIFLCCISCCIDMKNKCFQRKKMTFNEKCFDEKMCEISNP